jgi:hypothetical protein
LAEAFGADLAATALLPFFAALPACWAVALPAQASTAAAVNQPIALTTGTPPWAACQPAKLNRQDILPGWSRSVAILRPSARMPATDQSA